MIDVPDPVASPESDGFSEPSRWLLCVLAFLDASSTVLILSWFFTCLGYAIEVLQGWIAPLALLALAGGVLNAFTLVNNLMIVRKERADTYEFYKIAFCLGLVVGTVGMFIGMFHPMWMSVIVLFLFVADQWLAHSTWHHKD